MNMIRNMTKSIPEENQILRLLGIYLCNYKLKNQNEFNKLCDLINKQGSGKQVQ